MNLVLAAAGGTSWPDAAIAISGVVLVTVLAAVALVQIFSTFRARAAIAREDAYQALAERSATAQSATSQRLESMVTELGDVRRRTIELERMLKEVG
jgi:hypothetical protein